MQESENKEKRESKKPDYQFIAQLVIAGILVMLLAYNIGRISSSGGSGIGGEVIGTVSASEIIPAGVPAVYGNELGIRYDDISAANQRQADTTISVLGNFDNAITFTTNYF